MLTSTKTLLMPAVGLTLLLATPQLGAQNFEVGGSSYTVLDENSVELTRYGGAGGAVILPETVASEGKTYSLTSIGKQSFMMQMGVTSVVVPVSVTNIGDYAFSGSGITSVTLSDNVSVIGASAFYSRRSFTTIVNFPKKLEKIGAEAFYKDENLKTTITISQGCEIGDRAFDQCQSISEIRFNGVPSQIGEDALNLPRLMTVNMNLITPPDFSPVATFKLEAQSFASMTLNVPRGCKSSYEADTDWNIFGTINEVDFSEEDLPGDDVKRLSVEVLTPGTLSSLVPEDVSREISSLIVSGKLNGTDIAFIRSLGTNLTDLDISGADIVEGGDCYLSSSAGMFFTSDNIVGAFMFSRLSNLKSVRLPDSATSIEPYAFMDNAVIKDVTVGEATKLISEMTFGGCSSLSQVTLSGTTETIGNYCFAQCSALKEITLPEGLRKIGDNAFNSCLGLETVNLPQSLESIGSQAFFNCQSLAEITIPASVSVIGYSTFGSCGSLKNIMVAEANPTYSSIDGVLYDKEVKTLINYPIGKDDSVFNMPQSVTSVGDYAFQDCRLEKIIFSENVESLGESVCYSCKNLTTVVLSEKTTSIPRSAFSACTLLYQINLHENISEIGTEAFMGCGFTEISIPEGIKEISASAFWGNRQLAALSLPSSLSYIGESAFYADPLTEIYLKAAVPPQLYKYDVYSPFGKVDRKKCKLYVPRASVETYKAATVWQDFDITADLSGSDSVASDMICHPVAYYDLQGRKIDRPTEGFCIVRMSDGTARKLLIR